MVHQSDRSVYIGPRLNEEQEQDEQKEGLLYGSSTSAHSERDIQAVMSLHP